MGTQSRTHALLFDDVLNMRIIHTVLSHKISKVVCLVAAEDASFSLRASSYLATIVSRQAKLLFVIIGTLDFVGCVSMSLTHHQHHQQFKRRQLSYGGISQGQPCNGLRRLSPTCHGHLHTS